MHIVPYEEKYDEQILQLEKGIVQGKGIQLEIVKNKFLDRANVFQKYKAMLAIGSNDDPVGTCIGARVQMSVNATIFDAGYGFEAKVSPAIRNRGLGKRMAKSLYSNFFRPEGLTKAFTTLKQNNIPIVRLLKKAIPGLWFYDFVYLTIPCKERLTVKVVNPGKKQLLTVRLFGEHGVDPSFFFSDVSGLAYFNTFKMYKVKVSQVSWLWKLVLWLNRRTNFRKHATLPAVGDTITFATLFNHTPGNILQVNGILENLSNKGIHYLTVCCRRDDSIFKTLKTISINTYNYYLLSDFPLSKKDEVAVDVRCL